MSKGDPELAALVAALDLTQDEEIEMGQLVGKFRRRHAREIEAMEAARLLPLGAEVVALRQGCHRATAYRRAQRAIVALRTRNATTP